MRKHIQCSSALKFLFTLLERPDRGMHYVAKRQRGNVSLPGACQVIFSLYFNALFTIN